MNPNIDNFLLDRIRHCLSEQGVEWIEKRMFGGCCFMVDDKMCLGTFRGGIMARVGPDELANLLDQAGVEQMMNGGRVMKGYAFLQPEAYDADVDMQFWIDKCLAFNPLARASKKKKR